ncbi:hypothetical protein VTN96DRAFT_3138 [Rasamsonia emersonii]
MSGVIGIGDVFYTIGDISDKLDLLFDDISKAQDLSWLLSFYAQISGNVSEQLEIEYRSANRIVILVGYAQVTYAIVDSTGARLKANMVWPYSGDTNYKQLAQQAFERFAQASAAYDEKFQARMRRWGRRQRQWEWSLFLLAREYANRLRWPRGTTTTMIINGDCDTVISKSVVDSTVAVPPIAPRNNPMRFATGPPDKIPADLESDSEELSEESDRDAA